MAQDAIALNRVAATVAGGNCVPAAAFDWTAAECGDRIGVSDDGYVKLNPNELARLDEVAPLGCQFLSVQYMNTSSPIQVLSESGTLLGAGSVPVFRKIADPDDAAKKCIEFRVGIQDSPNTQNGSVNTSDAKRTEGSWNVGWSAGDRFHIAFAWRNPSGAGNAKALPAGNRFLFLQVHDDNLGSGLGPVISFKIEGGASAAAVRRVFQINGDATVPNNDAFREVWSQAGTDWPDDEWEFWVVEGKFHYDITQGPYTNVYRNGVQLVADTGINFFNDSASTSTKAFTHYPKIGIYWYNQAAASWDTGEIIQFMKRFRCYKNRPTLTEPALRAFEEAA